jgi:hypothetical protein
MARRHGTCWIHVSFRATSVLSLPQNDAIDPFRTFTTCTRCAATFLPAGCAILIPKKFNAVVEPGPAARLGKSRVSIKSCQLSR